MSAQPPVKPKISLKDFRPQIERIERRLFLKQGLSLGALSMLSGCTLKDDDAVDKLLWAMSRWNDRVQAAIFDPAKLAEIGLELKKLAEKLAPLISLQRAK